MKATLLVLCKEHKSLLDDLTLIEESSSFQSYESLPILLNRFKSLERFTVNKHHKREDEILFNWMLQQNSNSDATIINRIRSEHQELESKQNQIIANLERLLADHSIISLKTLYFDITDFIDLYREHIQIEEKFIYLIADGLITANQR